MTERELRRLSRTDLLELLLAQRRENEQLRCILDQTQAQLADRTIKIEKAGSIAEASLQLSGVFAAAQDSCQYYLDNIKLLSERQNTVCQQMEQETREKCDKMVAEAEQKAQQCWENCSVKIRQLVASFEGLQQVLQMYSAFSPKPSEPAVNIFSPKPSEPTDNIFGSKPNEPADSFPGSKPNEPADSFFGNKPGEPADSIFGKIY